VAVFNNKMWVLAGHNKRLTMYPTTYLRNDVWCSDNGVDWIQLPNAPWPPTHAASVFIYDSSLWIAAGYLKNDVWRLTYPKHDEIITYQFGLHADVYPNPASDYINIAIHTHLPEKINVDGYIYDRKGALVRSFQTSVQTRVVEQIDLKGLSDGNYILKVFSGGQTSTVKFLVGH
jgi:hypothetical protein